MAPSHYSPNTTNYEFSTAPRSSYLEPFPVRFYLNHFRSSTQDYVLDETGWDSITQFEDRARVYDMFTTHIAPNGFLTCDLPQVDPECFRVFEFSLHHLKRDVLDRLMYYYIGMNLTDYELQHPAYNTIYLAVPYYSWVCGNDLRTEGSKLQQLATCCEKKTQLKTQPKSQTKTETCDCERFEVYPMNSDSETDFSEDEFVPDMSSKLLSGWKFRFNSETKNSYVLEPPQAVTKVSGGHVYWGTGHSVPTTWKLQMKGLDRPLYYNTKYGGWIVSLALGDTLLLCGATLKK
jgi:hypothetical protein